MFAIEPPRYRFREGALDHVMRSRNLSTDTQLAAALGVPLEDLPRLRSGALVSARLALKVSQLQGVEDYIASIFDPVYEDGSAA